MKRYTAILEASVNDHYCPVTLEDVRYDKHVIIYTFWNDDKEIGTVELSIDKDTYDYIKVDMWQSDFCDNIQGKYIEHTRTDGDVYHGTWK